MRIGRSVWLNLQPLAADQAQDGAGVILEPTQGGLQAGAQAGHARMDAVGEVVLEDVPELFTRVEFRRVGRQVDDPHPSRQARIPIAQMGRAERDSLPEAARRALATPA